MRQFIPAPANTPPLPCQVRPMEAVSGELLSVMSGGSDPSSPIERSAASVSVTVSSE